MMTQTKLILAGLLVILLCIAGWITHLITCFKLALWGYLIAGAIMFPIGILHGFYIWFT